MEYSLDKLPIKEGGARTEKGAEKFAGKKAEQKKFETKNYTEKEIRDQLSAGYMAVPRQYWDYIPKGAHVRYLKKDDGSNEPVGKRFKPGGYVKFHSEKKVGDKTDHTIVLENMPARRDTKGYVSFPVAYNTIEELWKKYDENAFIEIQLFAASLAEKKAQIADLNTRIKKLETIVDTLRRR
jgi:hypothetical protein